MIGTVLAAWLLASVPVAAVLGQMLRRSSDRYPLYDPRPAYLAHGGPTVNPYALDRAELGKIVDMFDPAALVVAEPTPAGYFEVVFPDVDDAVRFVEIVRDGKYGAPPVAEATRVVARATIGDQSGPVTLGVTLLPAWRPLAVAS